MGRTDIFDPLMKTAHERIPDDELEQNLLCPGGLTLVHQTARHNRVAMLQTLIRQYGFSPNRCDEYGYTPLHFAAIGGALEALDFLRKKCELTVTIKEKDWTCLHLAAANGQEKIVDRILQLPDGLELLKATDSYLQTALHHAASNKHAQCITTLLGNGKGLDPNQENEDRDTPILLLLRDFDRPIWSSQKADTNLDEEEAVASLRALLADPRTNPNVRDKRDRLPITLVEKHLALLRELLEDPRVDLSQPVRKDGDTGIFLAARGNVWSAVRRYIKEHGLPEGSKTDSEENTFLHHLTSRTAPKDLFFDRISEIPKEQLNTRNKKSETPFSRAMSAKNWSLGDRLLETGLIDLHTEDDAFKWELWMAMQLEAPEGFLKKLVSNLNGQLTKPDQHGWTIVHHIAAANHTTWP